MWLRVIGTGSAILLYVMNNYFKFLIMGWASFHLVT